MKNEKWVLKRNILPTCRTLGRKPPQVTEMLQTAYGNVERVTLAQLDVLAQQVYGCKFRDALPHMTGMGKGSIGRQGELLLKIDPRD